MLDKLYEKGYLDYKTMILDNYKTLNLEEKEAFIMIKVLDQCQKKRNIKINEIVQSTSFSKDEVQEILYKLSELGFYETYFELISGKGEEEFYNINPFFVKMEKIIKESATHTSSEIKQIIDILENKLCRPLTALELETISTWLDEEYKTEDIIYIVNDFISGSHLTFKAIEKQLINYKRRNVRESVNSQLSKEDEATLNKFRKMINDKKTVTYE